MGILSKSSIPSAKVGDVETFAVISWQNDNLKFGGLMSDEQHQILAKNGFRQIHNDEWLKSYRELRAEIKFKHEYELAAKVIAYKNKIRDLLEAAGLTIRGEQGFKILEEAEENED